MVSAIRNGRFADGLNSMRGRVIGKQDFGGKKQEIFGVMIYIALAGGRAPAMS